MDPAFSGMIPVAGSIILEASGMNQDAPGMNHAP